MTMTDAVLVILTALPSSVVGAIAGGWMRSHWRGWRRPVSLTGPQAPAPGRLRVQNLPMECPHCGKAFSANIEIEGPFPQSNDPAALKAAGWEPTTPPFECLPLGERLLAEKRELQARRDALLRTPGDPRARLDSIGRRIEAIDRELGRFN